MKRNKREQAGAAVLEFTFGLLVLIPLLLGTLTFGFLLVRDQQMNQVVRDIAHMYSRGIDFTAAGPAGNANTLAGQFSLTSSGKSVLILSTIQIETSAACLAAVGNSNCPNLNKPVFTQQIAIGNQSVGSSPFGTPVSSGSLPSNGVDYSTNITAVNQANSSWAVANNFGAVLALNAGEVTYVVEMINSTPDLNVAGLAGAPQVYTRAIF